MRVLTVVLLGLVLVTVAKPAECAAQEDPLGAAALRPVRYELDLRLDYEDEKLFSRVSLTVANRSATPTDQLPILLYRTLTVTGVEDAEGRAVQFEQGVAAFHDWPQRQANVITVRLSEPLAPGDSATVVISYEGYLLGYAETGTRYQKDRIDPEFTIIRRDPYAYPIVSHPSLQSMRAAGLPQFDYRATITVPGSVTVANVGRLVGHEVEGGNASWIYENHRTAWRMDFAVAQYGVHEADGHKVFYFPEDSVGARRVMDGLTRTLALFSGWFGPQRGEARFTLIEIPDGWGSQTDVTGIIQTAAAFRDPARSHELYHEVSHLWNVVDPGPAPPRWNEGLAEFLSELTTEELEGGEAVATAVEEQLRWIRERFVARPRYAGIPMADYGRENITGLSYHVGLVMFAVLYDLVGAETFNEIVGGFYQRYADTGATTDEFVVYAKSVSGMNLGRFFHDWMYTTEWYSHVRDGAALEDLVTEYR